MYFKFVKRLDTTHHSIFYSLIPYKDCILAVGRHNYAEHQLKFMLLNEELNVISDDEKLIIDGEDPRTFYHNGDVYIQDNYWNDVHLINFTQNTSTKVDISGKNFSFISHKSRLFFIHIMCPFTMYEFCEETGEIFPVRVKRQKTYVNYEYRGGTPGYHLYDSIYYGFGHRTYYEENVLKHDVFYWEVDFEGKYPNIMMYSILQPPGSLNICDPTSLIKIHGKEYLITAESEFSWFQDQDYVTNIYEIIWDNI
jgi:hypothetical protein